MSPHPTAPTHPKSARTHTQGLKDTQLLEYVEVYIDFSSQHLHERKGVVKLCTSHNCSKIDSQLNHVFDFG